MHDGAQNTMPTATTEREPMPMMPVPNMLAEINRGLLLGLKRWAKLGTLTGEECQALRVRCEGACPKRPMAYALTSVRNALLDKRRRVEAAICAALCAAEAQRLQDEEQAHRDAAWREFAEIERRLVASETLTGPQRMSLRLVRLACLLHADHETLAYAFPRTTQAQRWQWKRRGILLIEAQGASDWLMRCLTERGCWQSSRTW